MKFDNARLMHDNADFISLLPHCVNVPSMGTRHSQAGSLAFPAWEVKQNASILTFSYYTSNTRSQMPKEVFCAYKPTQYRRLPRMHSPDQQPDQSPYPDHQPRQQCCHRYGNHLS